MKSIRTLLFIIAIIAILVAGWYFFPAEGLSVGGYNLRFPSFADDTAEKNQEEQMDVDAVIDNVNKSYKMAYTETLYDSLCFFRDYLKENPNRIYLPNDDYTYFDTVFAQFERAEAVGKTYRVMYYGDSQIEMDRISSVFRQKLQELFGGSGPSMIPAIQPVATISVTQHASNLRRHMVYGDAARAGHNRYGIMWQFGQAVGSSSISFSQSTHSQAFAKVKEITKVSVLLGNNSEGFTASLKCDTIATEPKTLAAKEGVSLLTWTLPRSIKKGTISFKGSGEIYAVMLDGEAGVAVDNVALRGCAGNLFTRLNESVMRQSFDLIDTRLIILQFGGNRMPGIAGTKNISSYMTELESQIDYMKKVAPKCTFLFIGPADMGKSYNGKMGTWKGLPELNDSLRAMALRNDVAYWDMFNVMGGEGSMAQWVKHSPPLAGPDYIHFTFRGAQEIGASLAKSFTTYYDFYQLRQRIPNQDVIDFVNGDERQNVQKMPYTRMIPSYKPFYDN